MASPPHQSVTKFNLSFAHLRQRYKSRKNSRLSVDGKHFEKGTFNERTKKILMRFHRKRHLHTLQYSVKGTWFYSINKLRRIRTQTVTRHEVYKNYDYLQAISNISAKENGKFSSSYSPCEQSF